MKIASAPTQGIYEAKGSKFLAFLQPFASFESSLAMLKNQHPKAVHFVYAYRFINENEQICERSSDDGEPKGSSGVPTLNVLRGEGLLDSSMIIVRYFGGTLLGVGGLVRAYTKAAQEAIAHAKANNTLLPYQKLESMYVECPYSQFEALKYKAKLHNVRFIDVVFLEDKIRVLAQGTLINLESTTSYLAKF